MLKSSGSIFSALYWNWPLVNALFFFVAKDLRPIARFFAKVIDEAEVKT